MTQRKINKSENRWEKQLNQKISDLQETTNSLDAS